MMKKTFWGILPVCLLALGLTSCAEAKVKEHTHRLTDHFEHIDTIHATSQTFGVVPEEWMLTERQLVCRTENSEALYAVFDRKTLLPAGTFGRRGNGHLEWTMPHAVDNGAESLIVMDNASRKLYAVKDNALNEVGVSCLQDVVNDVKAIAYPVIGYVASTPEAQKLVVANLQDGTHIDSVFVEAREGQSAMLDFSWTCSSHRLAMGFQYANRFILCQTDAEGHIKAKDIYDGGGKSQQDKIYFTDVACDDYIYLLSQKQVNVNTGEGHSEIEVYTFEGRPVKKMVLDFIAFKMLLDKDGQRLLMSSPADEDIRIVKIGTKTKIIGTK